MINVQCSMGNETVPAPARSSAAAITNGAAFGIDASKQSEIPNPQSFTPSPEEQRALDSIERFYRDSIFEHNLRHAARNVELNDLELERRLAAAREGKFLNERWQVSPTVAERCSNRVVKWLPAKRTLDLLYKKECNEQLAERSPWHDDVMVRRYGHLVSSADVERLLDRGKQEPVAPATGRRANNVGSRENTKARNDQTSPATSRATSPASYGGAWPAKARPFGEAPQPEINGNSNDQCAKEGAANSTPNAEHRTNHAPRTRGTSERFRPRTA